MSRSVRTPDYRNPRPPEGEAMQAAVLDDHYDSDWKDDAIATIIGLSLAHPVFSADDLTREMRKPPRSSQVGAAFRSAQSQGLIESVGYEISTNKTRNRGRHLQWRRKAQGVTE